MPALSWSIGDSSTPEPGEVGYPSDLLLKELQHGNRFSAGIDSGNDLRSNEVIILADDHLNS